jgi:thiol:disulfide interchange protein
MKYFFVVLMGFFLFSCGNSIADSNQENVTVQDSYALAKIAVDIIDFYSEDNTDSISTILNNTINKGKTPILFFTASWCKPCREFKESTKYELVAQSLKDATIIMIDVNKDQPKNGYALDYGARAIPTFIIVDKDGNAMNTITGAAWVDNRPNNIAPAMEDFLKG